MFLSKHGIIFMWKKVITIITIISTIMLIKVFFFKTL